MTQATKVSQSTGCTRCNRRPQSKGLNGKALLQIVLCWRLLCVKIYPAGGMMTVASMTYVTVIVWLNKQQPCMTCDHHSVLNESMYHTQQLGSVLGLNNQRPGLCMSYQLENSLVAGSHSSCRYCHQLLQRLLGLGRRGKGNVCRLVTPSVCCPITRLARVDKRFVDMFTSRVSMISFFFFICQLLSGTPDGDDWAGPLRPLGAKLSCARST